MFYCTEQNDLYGTQSEFCVSYDHKKQRAQRIDSIRKLFVNDSCILLKVRMLRIPCPCRGVFQQL